MDARAIKGGSIRGHASFYCHLRIPEDFMRWGIDRGLLLYVLAEQARSFIDERTDGGHDVWQVGFAPYKPVRRLVRNEDGSIKRDARGRWEVVVVQDSRDHVSLRSAEDVPIGRRMRDSLRIHPQVIRSDAQFVTIKPTGGRDGVSHMLRAWTASGARVDSARRGGMSALQRMKLERRHRDDPSVPLPPPQATRLFIGIQPSDWTRIVADTTQAGVLAFLMDRELGKTKSRQAIESQISSVLSRVAVPSSASSRLGQMAQRNWSTTGLTKQQEIVHRQIADALRAQERVRRSREAAAQRAAASARVKNQARKRRLERCGPQPGEDARAAWNRTQSEKRKTRRERKLAKQKG